MSRPVALKSGVFHLDARVPADLAAKARGQRVTLPIGGSTVSAKIGDKVIVSLGTRDVRVAKDRHARAAAALMAFWQAMDQKAVVQLGLDRETLPVVGQRPRHRQHRRPQRPAGAGHRDLRRRHPAAALAAHRG